MKKALSLDKIWLIPRKISTLKSRKDVDTSQQLDIIKSDLPIIASPMVDVVSQESIFQIEEAGGLASIHRFYPNVHEQCNSFLCSTKSGFCSIGTNLSTDITRFKSLYNVGAHYFIVDTANGANEATKAIIEKCLEIHYDARFIVGNVASIEGFNWLSNLPNVIGIRVGISPGTACTTKDATGVYHPMASLLKEIRDGVGPYKNNSGIIRRPAIIADGGLNTINKVVKAIAIGADYVMLGAMIAQTKDSPAKLIEVNGQYFKSYSGSASFSVQKLVNDKPSYIEGTTKLLPYSAETIKQLFKKIKDGLQSSMSYMNATNIFEYQENADFCHE